MQIHSAIFLDAYIITRMPVVCHTYKCPIRQRSDRRYAIRNVGFGLCGKDFETSLRAGRLHGKDCKSQYQEEDMICIDVGHHMIHNIDFVAYMPHLKYLILAHSGVRDLSPIVNCQELVYLEIDWSEVQSYEPLKELKALEDLNLAETYCDITPILEMTWLKNLWVPGRSYATRQLLIESLPNTHLQLNKTAPAGETWRDLPNYFAQRDVLGMHYMK